MSRRATPSVPTASLADVGFLLLVFFLVATTIRSEHGLPAVRPRAADVPPLVVAPGSLLSVDVRGDGRVALDGVEVPRSRVRDAVAAHAAGGAQRVALRAARATPYHDYIATLDAILLGHRDVGVPPRLAFREPVD